MLASLPASMLNQKLTDLGILNRFNLVPSRSRLNFGLFDHLASFDGLFEHST
jgi:hypothetical protein